MIGSYDSERELWTLTLPNLTYYAMWRNRGWNHNVITGDPIDPKHLVTRDASIASTAWNWMDHSGRDALREAASRTGVSSYDLARAPELAVNSGELYQFQKDGVSVVIARFNYGHKRALIADEMGLGKTVQALSIMSHLWDELNGYCLIVCPASLTLNWRREVLKWLAPLGVTDLSVAVSDYRRMIEAGAKIIIVSYSSISKVLDLIPRFSIAILDEAHFVKNQNAKRSKQCLFAEDSVVARSDYAICMTGTPAPNRASDAWAMLHFLNPDAWPDKKLFEMETDGLGFDEYQVIGLQARLSGMIRRYKKDVLPQLPEKTRRIVELPVHDDGEIRAYRESLGDLVNTIDWSDSVMVGRMLADVQGSLMTARVNQSCLKMRHVLRYLEETVAEGESVVLFCVFREAISGLLEALGESAVAVYGGISSEARDMAVTAFQAGEARFFIGQIVAAGAGLTLTRACRLIFVDIDWTPANMEQAEDRVHRIGQDRGVLIEYLVAEDSLDYHMISSMLEKQKQRAMMGM